MTSANAARKPDPMIQAVRQGSGLRLASSISAEQLIARIKQRCEEDFTFFVRYFFKHRKGTKFIFNEHHEVICQDLMDVFNGKVEGYICNMPPRYGKTELIVIMFVLWCFVKNRRSEFIHLSYALSLTLENSDAIRTIMKSKEFLQLWPDLTTKDSKDSKHAWATREGGSFLAAQSAGSVTGFGAGRLDEWNERTDEFTFSGCIIIDDPLKPDDARHDVVRKAVNGRWHSTIKSRRNSPRTPVICVMQRLHEDDFTAELLRDDDIKWRHRVMQALIHDENGERALWPMKHDVERLKKIKAVNEYHFASQMQQSPAPAGGGVFKDEWNKFWTVLPELEYRMIYADTAMKTGEENDYSVFQHWGKGKDGKIYLLDMIRGKWEAPQLLTQAAAFWDKCRHSHSGTLRKMKPEDKASGTGLIQQLKQKGVPVEGIPRSKDKVTRGYDAAPQVEVGNVLLPNKHELLSDLLGELSMFPVAKHCDMVDPLMDAINDMLVAKQGYAWSGL